MENKTKRKGMGRKDVSKMNISNNSKQLTKETERVVKENKQKNNRQKRKMVQEYMKTKKKIK